MTEKKTEKEMTLRRFIQQEINQPCHSSARALADAILRRHGERVVAILFYGPCLRQEESDDPPEGIHNFYVIVDRFKDGHQGRFFALANRLLPPNVFYVERRWQGRKVRAKYAVISMKQWRRFTSVKAFHPWLWARFAQPSALLYERDATSTSDIVGGMTEAVTTMLRESLPLVGTTITPRDLWLKALSQTYQVELRSEGSDRSASIYEANSKRYDEITPLALKELTGLPMKIIADGRIETSFFSA